MAAVPGNNGFARLLIASGGGGGPWDCPFSTTGLTASPCALWPGTVGATVQVQVFQNAGANVNVSSGNIRMTRIGP
jgi:hypothetical protein